MEDAPFQCPTCTDITAHAVLKATRNNMTIRCQECGTTRTRPAPTQKTVTLQLVLSHGERSSTDRIEAPVDEEVQVGDEFDHQGHRMLVTALELEGGRNVQKAVAKDVGTVFAKVFDTVVLKYTINEGDRTVSLQEEVPPEEEIQMGSVRRVQGRDLVVKTLKSDRNRTVRKGFLYARNVVRVFCDPAPPGVRPGAAVDIRSLPSRRGAEPEKRRRP